MKQIWKCLFILSLSMVISGCWDLKDPQDKNYYTAIGIDYEDGKYLCYVQMLDFSSIAKTEYGKPLQHLPIWIGKGEGETPVVAFEDLYKTSQLRVFYGHVNTFIYSERLLKKGIDSVLDLQNRYYELRYTPWVFATKESIEDVLTTTPFFYLSPMMSLIHLPEQSYKQYSVIKPMTIREFIIDYREPGKTAYIPAIGTDTSTWKEDNKPNPKLKYTGAFLLHDRTFKTFLDIEQLTGLKWITPSTNRSQLVIRHHDEIIAVLSLEKPKIKITSEIRDEKIYFDVNVTLSGNLLEMVQPMTEQKMEELAAEQVENEIMKTYEEGIKLGADLLQFEHTFYRQHTQAYKTMYRDKAFQLQPDMLQLEVNVDLISSGKLKFGLTR